MAPMVAPSAWAMTPAATPSITEVALMVSRRLVSGSGGGDAHRRQRRPRGKSDRQPPVVVASSTRGTSLTGRPPRARKHSTFATTGAPLSQPGAFAVGRALGPYLLCARRGERDDQASSLRNRARSRFRSSPTAGYAGFMRRSVSTTISATARRA